MPNRSGGNWAEECMGVRRRCRYIYRATCAGKLKRGFTRLIDPQNERADYTLQKYGEECRLLSSLNHPNSVKFLGIKIYFLKAQSDYAPSLPVLVMERLDRSFDDLLENTPNIPLAQKCSILQDVARGLDYLHSHSPVIIHRDLTAQLGNVGQDNGHGQRSHCRF